MSLLSNKTGSGAPMIWVTGMGLAIGLAMVVGLLSLIIYRGIETFWPQPVVQVELRADDEGGEKEIVAGEVVLKQEKKVIHDGDSDFKKEWQLFQGNKDIFGESFLFIDEERVVLEKYPGDIMVMERLEYGDGIGYPQKIKLKSGEEILASQDDFETKFDALVTQGVERWEEIKEIEKYKIGEINRDMEEIHLKKKEILSQNQKQNSEALVALEVKKKDLEDKYQTLAAKAKELRKLQTQDKFIYKVASGEEKTLAIGQILHYYYPNRLDTQGRFKLFAHNFWNFLSEDPREANTEGGIFPAIFGTFVMTLLMSLVVTPFGVIAAIYLREYAKQGFFVRMVRVAVNNLAGVPSIVFGVFGLGFFVYLVGGTMDHLLFADRLPTPTFGTGGLLWASLTLALMTVPVVIVSTEEALASVTQGLREAGLACGASKWQTIYRIVLPASAPGILTGVILAMARGAGEVAPLMLVGVVKLAPTLPINSIFPYVHLDQKFMHLGFHIYDLGFQSPDSEAAKPMVFATTLFLILLVILLNVGAMFIRERLRRKYATGAF